MTQEWIFTPTPSHSHRKNPVTNPLDPKMYWQDPANPVKGATHRRTPRGHQENWRCSHMLAPVGRRTGTSQCTVGPAAARTPYSTGSRPPQGELQEGTGGQTGGRGTARHTTDTTPARTKRHKGFWSKYHRERRKKTSSCLHRFIFCRQTTTLMRIFAVGIKEIQILCYCREFDFLSVYTSLKYSGALSASPSGIFEIRAILWSWNMSEIRTSDSHH